MFVTQCAFVCACEFVCLGVFVVACFYVFVCVFMCICICGREHVSLQGAVNATYHHQTNSDYGPNPQLPNGTD